MEVSVAEIPERANELVVLAGFQMSVLNFNQSGTVPFLNMTDDFSHISTVSCVKAAAVPCFPPWK